MKKTKEKNFEDMKTLCYQSWRERKGCRQGYVDMIGAETVGQMMLVFRKHLADITGERFRDVLYKNMEMYYVHLKQKFNDAEVFFNECPNKASRNVLVFIGDSETPIDVYDNARIFVLGKVQVIAHGRTIVKCENAEATIVAKDASSCFANVGKVIAEDYSVVQCSGDVECHDMSSVICTGGTVRDYGHHSLSVFRDTRVYSDNIASVIANGDEIEFHSLNR